MTTDPTESTSAQTIGHSVHDLAAASQAEKKYGHRHLRWWFNPFLTVTQSGFIFRGKEYAWSDVVAVKEQDFSGFNWGTAKYRAWIRLSDGERIALNCRALELAGTKPKVNFSSTKTDAYEELLTRMRRAL